MRMWCIDPAHLCRRHLGGAHVELHMMAGAIRRGKSIAGHISRGQMQTDRIAAEHAALAAELDRRAQARGAGGHRSPLAYTDMLAAGHVDPAVSQRELWRRCPDCRRRMQEAGILLEDIAHD